MYQGSFTAQAATISYAVTIAAGASVKLPGTGSTVRIVNEGPNHAYVSIGPGTQTATLPSPSAQTTCTPVLAGTDSTFTIPNTIPGSALSFSAICITGTATLDIQVGEGQ
jgi:hypothetical protein